MIDIHCHILPAFDDGSTGMAESLAMAEMAVSSGVTDIVTTPHFNGEMSSVRQLQPLVDHYRLLKRALQQEEIPLKLHLGCEILCTPQTPAMAERHALPTIGNSDYLLTEFHFGESAGYMTQMLDALRGCGYRPVVAHPERYDVVQKDPLICRYWTEKIGCALQLNKGSLLGAFGGRVQRASYFLIDNGLAHVIASDAHGADHRTPHMGRIRQLLEDQWGPDYARLLTERNPARILENNPVIPPDRRS